RPAGRSSPRVPTRFLSGARVERPESGNARSPVGGERGELASPAFEGGFRACRLARGRKRSPRNHESNISRRGLPCPRSGGHRGGRVADPPPPSRRSTHRTSSQGARPRIPTDLVGAPVSRRVDPPKYALKELWASEPQLHW